jgi:hypothetical protein
MSQSYEQLAPLFIPGFLALMDQRLKQFNEEHDALFVAEHGSRVGALCSFGTPCRKSAVRLLWQCFPSVIRESLRACELAVLAQTCGGLRELVIAAVQQKAKAVYHVSLPDVFVPLDSSWTFELQLWERQADQLAGDLAVPLDPIQLRYREKFGDHSDTDDFTCYDDLSKGEVDNTIWSSLQFDCVAKSAALILSTIWELGDKDEVGSKFPGHALGAVLAGYTWHDARDYGSPGFEYSLLERSAGAETHQSAWNASEDLVEGEEPSYDFQYEMVLACQMETTLDNKIVEPLMDLCQTNLRKVMFHFGRASAHACLGEDFYDRYSGW